MPRQPQGVYWLGTIPEDQFVAIGPPPLNVAYIRGQLETGATTGYTHWQLLVVLSTKKTLNWVSSSFPGGHWELSRSNAADEYVWKEDTRVPGTQFELGTRPFRRNNATDWSAIVTCAKSGNLDDIPPDVYVRCYNQLKRIRMDHLVPARVERTCYVFWGRTGTGKSRRAWDEATDLAYAKDPCTKWWCSYKGQENVVLDEFRGSIGISHLLRWLDRYPVCVETKGGSEPLVASKIWITSNLDPQNWYPDLDQASKDALLRRLIVTEFE